MLKSVYVCIKCKIYTYISAEFQRLYLLFCKNA